MPNISKLVSTVTDVTPSASYSDKRNKRESSGPIEIEHEDTAKSPKRKKNVTEYREEQNMMTARYGFEFKEYSFVSTSTGSMSQFRDNMELSDIYRETKDTTSTEALKMCAEVRKIFGQEVPLISIRYQTHNTLKLALTTNNKVAKVGRNLYDNPIPDLIHFHKKLGTSYSQSC